jgi:alpha-L-fucosidase
MLLLFIIFFSPLFGHYQPTDVNLAARKSFQEDRFGLFVHWGIYSQLAHGEWVMENNQMSVEKYEQIAPLFYPIKFNAAEWVSIVKAAGMRYITITAKHHDGFAMFGTKQNKWNIVDATPYGKDVMKMLAEECRKQGVKLFFYYSQLDWHHPDYFPLGRTGYHAKRPFQGLWTDYIQFMNAQLTELLTDYGPIAGIWFDGWWDKPQADWELASTFDLIHRLQPEALIGSNHHQTPFEGQDFQIFEQDLPGEKTNQFELDSKISRLPLESCLTIQKSTWGVNFVEGKDSLRPAKDLIHDLAGSAGRNANLLLNIGPLSDGTFSHGVVKRLKEVGKWLSQYGESIYETQGGPLQPRSWGVTTQKGNKIYVHLLKWEPQDHLWLPIENAAEAYYLNYDGVLKYEASEDGILLKNIDIHDPYDTVVVIVREF